MGKRSSLCIESGMESSMNVRDWLSLPSEIIELILEKLHFNFVDVIRLGAVCKSWHNITTKRSPKSLPPQLPWLLLSSLDTKIETPFRFLNISDNKIYSLPPPPYPTSSNRCTSTDGWLFIFENDSASSLVNPMTRQQVVLPHIPHPWKCLFSSESREKFTCKFSGQSMKSLMRKVVLSSPPNDNDNHCLLMAITRVHFFPLLFCKVGATNWKLVIDDYSNFALQLFQDGIYFKGKFYAVDSYGKIVVCNLTSSSPVIEQIKPCSPTKFDSTYLVDLWGELVFIAKFKQESSGTTAFHLFRQDSITKEWIQIETIGDHAIFLGYNHSVSLLASNYSGCRGNCIYFNFYEQVNSEAGDCGIFNLGNGLVEPLPCCSNSESTTQFPVWVATSLW